MLQGHIEEGLAALGVRVAALAEHRVAGNRLLHAVARQRDRGNPRLRQRAQLTRVALPVLVQVLPDAELAPVRIARIELPVAVRVEMRKTLKVSLRPFHIGHEGQLVMLGDRSVAVLVIGQEPVIRRRPSHTLPVAVAVDVVKRRRIVQRHKLHTVPVQVQHDRLAAAAPTVAAATVAAAIFTTTVAFRIGPSGISTAAIFTAAVAFCMGPSGISTAAIFTAAVAFCIGCSRISAAAKLAAAVAFCIGCSRISAAAKLAAAVSDGSGRRTISAATGGSGLYRRCRVRPCPNCAGGCCNPACRDWSLRRTPVYSHTGPSLASSA